MQKDFSGVHWSFFGPGEEDEWYGMYAYKPEGEWDKDVNLVIKHFEESGERRNIYDSLYCGIFKH